MKKKNMLLLWMGAAISLSEIFTGGLAAPLGFAKGLVAILAGHVIGCGLFALGAWVSYSRKETAMDSAVFSLGRFGGKFTALCNVAQLLGWTVVMIVQAGGALSGLVPGLPYKVCVLILGAAVLVWALIFGSPAGWINSGVVVLLAILCGVLFFEASTGGLGAGFAGAGGSAALVIELSIAMPVSWLPLVGDYSRKADSPVCAVLMPLIGYFTGSVLMYVFGMYIVIAGGADIFSFIAGSRFRIPACGVVLFSTLTTAFLDLYSAAISFTQFVKTKTERFPVLVAGLVAMLAAALFPAERYGTFLEQFLVLIGMVFVPVYTVVFLDFLLKKPCQGPEVPFAKILVVLAGMGVYRFFTVRGIGVPTVLSVLAVCLLYAAFELIRKRSEARA